MPEALLQIGSSAGGRPGLERVWSTWRFGTLAHAETLKHPLGCAVRVYMNGSFLFSMVYPTCELAKQEAQALNQAGWARGWTDQTQAPVESLRAASCSPSGLTRLYRRGSARTPSTTARQRHGARQGRAHRRSAATRKPRR
jgi:hypothetical protein